MNDDEPRKRPLEMRTSNSKTSELKTSESKTSESTQTGCHDANFIIRNLSENSVQISSKMFVKFIFIFSIFIGTMLGWYFSAFVNGRNNYHSLEKVKVQMSECRTHNDFLLSEFRKKDQFYDLTLKEKST